MSNRPRAIGINHVALEVGDIEEAIEFYREILAFELRGRTEDSAFIDMGDQFLALTETNEQTLDEHRHFGLVVDDPDKLKERLETVEAKRLDTGGLDFRDPWGNRIQIVAYEEIQFTKAAHISSGMGIDHLEKTEHARQELREKGLLKE